MELSEIVESSLTPVVITITKIYYPVSLCEWSSLQKFLPMLSDDTFYEM